MNEFLLKFFSFNSERAGEGVFRFSSPWPGVMTIIVVGSLILLFRHLYRTEKAKASMRVRRVMTVFRCLAAFVIIFMLFRPIHVVERVEERERYALLLIDDSVSMTLRDNYKEATKQKLASLCQEPDGPPQHPDPEKLTRLELVNAALNNKSINLVDSLRLNVELKAFSFSDTLKPIQLPTAQAVPDPNNERPQEKTFISIEPRGPVTRMGDAIANAANSLRGQQIAGLILITDGQSNLGLGAEDAVVENAVRRVPPFPIIAVGVGNPEAGKDLEILQVLAREACFVNDEVVFSVLIRNQGYETADVGLKLMENDIVVEEQAVSLPKSGESKDVKIRYRPRVVGRFTYEILLEEQEGEAVTTNNGRKHLMSVVDDKVRVLYVAGHPGWDYRFLKNAMIRDHSTEVSTLLQTADAEFVQEGNRRISRFPLNRQELYEYDVIVFSDVDFTSFSEEQFEAMLGFVEDLGGGIFFQLGPYNRLHSLANCPLSKLLPVVPTDAGVLNRAAIPDAFTPRLTPEGLGHPILNLEADPVKNAQRWSEMPGFYWYLPVQQARSGSQVLMEHPYDKNEFGNYPLLAVQIYGAGRSAFLAAASTWRWRNFFGDLYFYRFWGQSIRFLSTGRLLGQNRRATLVTDKNTYQLGDEVLISARLLDELYRPLEQPEINLQIRVNEGQETLSLKPVPRRPGTYKGTYLPQYSGQHMAIIELEAEEAVSRVFAVTKPSLEFDRAETNESLLRRLATLSGGHYFSLDQIGEVPGKISQLQENIVTEEEDELWDSPFFLLLFSGLLICEWVLRKRRMMI
ncbi:MAG: hypothetical protein O3B01_21465 [Planctomycetota bacterium]|nr:hypothetical protein [Planctomycetota bacterium]